MCFLRLVMLMFKYFFGDVTELIIIKISILFVSSFRIECDFCLLFAFYGSRESDIINYFAFGDSL